MVEAVMLPNAISILGLARMLVLTVLGLGNNALAADTYWPDREALAFVQAAFVDRDIPSATAHLSPHATRKTLPPGSGLPVMIDAIQSMPSNIRLQSLELIAGDNLANAHPAFTHPQWQRVRQKASESAVLLCTFVGGATEKSSAFAMAFVWNFNDTWSIIHIEDN